MAHRKIKVSELVRVYAKRSRRRCFDNTLTCNFYLLHLKDFQKDALLLCTCLKCFALVNMQIFVARKDHGSHFLSLGF